MPGNATVGQFVVGDGTLVGQTSLDATVVLGKPKLVLGGKAFSAVVYTGDFIVAPFPNRPKLLLNAEAVTVLAGSTVGVGKPALTLRGKPYIVTVPIRNVPGKPVLVLKGKPFDLAIHAIENMGKPTLYLNGKALSAAIPGLTPSVPWDLILTPSVPATADLVPSVPRTADLVPSIPEFR